MKKTIVGIAAFIAASALLAGTATAQLGKDEQKCVTTLHKDGYKLAAALSRQSIACLEGAHEGGIIDLPACLAADPDEDAAAVVTRTEEDARQRCGETPATFGVPAAFDDTILEAGIVHGRGLVTDILGSAPAAAGTAAGNACQATTLAKAGKFAATYGKAFSKCVRTALKEGATDDSALTACLAPDLTKAQDKLVTLVGKACTGVSPAVALPGDCSAETDASVGACVAGRVRCRACRQAATFAAIDSDCDLVDDAIDNDSCSFPVTLSGNAIDFSSGTRVAGATVWVLERPSMTTVTDVDGYFEFSGLEEGEEVSLVLEDPAYHPIQNGTVRLGANGAERVTFQAVIWSVYDALASILGLVPDELNSCQMVTTVTRVGKSIYDPGAHGEDNATVKIDPPVTEDHGPIYFADNVIPAPGLSRTSTDGGVLYVQMAPGEYVWIAHKGDFVFTRVKSKCRAGLLVNASPPWGLQKH